MMRSLTLLVVFLLTLGAVQAEPNGLEKLSVLEEAWSQGRLELRPYHVELLTPSTAHGQPVERTDTFIRLDNALYHAHFSSHRPDRLTETVTVVEDGERFTFTDSYVRSDPGGDPGTHRSLGVVFTDSVEAVTFLKSPLGNPHWQFILHHSGKESLYTVDPETGMVLAWETVDETGQVTHWGRRTLKPVDEEEARQLMERVVERALDNQQERNEEARTAQTQDNIAFASSILVILLVQGGAGWYLGRVWRKGSRYAWIPFTLGLVILVLLAYPAMELLLGGYYSMLLAALVDIPVFQLRIAPEGIPVYIFLSNLFHGLVFTGLFTGLIRLALIFRPHFQ